MILHPRSSWQYALPFSRYLQRLLLARPEIAEALEKNWQTPFTAEAMEAALQHVTDETTLKSALRQLRARVLAHLIVRDLTGQANLSEVMETMTQLADIAIQKSLTVLKETLKARYGAPLNHKGEPQTLMVVGMGKLGGRELNVSSDIDLVFVYPEDGEVSNFDYFNRLGRSLIAALSDITADGQVFRVDMRLRPHGESGPLSINFSMLENYLITQGRDWERYAWIKGRIITDPTEPLVLTSALDAITHPFIFRKYLDYSTIESLRNLHIQIRQEVVRRDSADNIKLGPGGIREIEFIAQVFQIIRGGRNTSLQARPTLTILQRLAEQHILSPAAAAELASAYDFIRRLEHRLQYLDDQQTHSLPSTDDDKTRIAQAMNYADWSAFSEALNIHRAKVSQHFEAIFAGNHHPHKAYTARERFDSLIPRIFEVSANTRHPDLTRTRMLELLDVIRQRSTYLALLLEYPHALKKLAELMDASSWAASYLNRHPILLDEFLDPRLIETAPNWTQFQQQLKQQLDTLEPDQERQMDSMREAHHTQVFRLLSQDIAGLLTIEALTNHLSALADIMLELTLHTCWHKLPNRHHDIPKFAVISYGKLGGKELGYASDLDIIFLYDDDSPNASECYARLAQRLNNWLSSRTSAGILFETDVRLRPDGESGLLVSSIAAFQRYQTQSAWVWEHQALTRARFSAGDKRIGDTFETIRMDILRLPRDLSLLKREILAMRQKMLETHLKKHKHKPELFHLKYDRGGLIDVEFIVQMLVLGYTSLHPELAANVGNIKLLQIAGELGLIPLPLATQVANAYREYRRLQHQARLNDAPQTIEHKHVAPLIECVQHLWENVFS